MTAAVACPPLTDGGFTGNAERLLGLLAHGVTSAGPLTDGLSHVTFTSHGTHATVPVPEASPATPAWLARRRPPDDRSWVEDQRAWDEFDLRSACPSAWDTLTETLLAASHPHLHPDSRHEFDPWNLGFDGGVLLIACAPLTDPAADPLARFDRDRDPFFTDMGVIAFPVRPFQMLNFLDAGMTVAGAAELTVRVAFASAWAHETFETWQSEPGCPWHSPHGDSPPDAHVTLTDGTVVDLLV